MSAIGTCSTYVKVLILILCQHIIHQLETLIVLKAIK